MADKVKSQKIIYFKVRPNKMKGGREYENMD